VPVANANGENMKVDAMMSKFRARKKSICRLLHFHLKGEVAGENALIKGEDFQEQEHNLETLSGRYKGEGTDHGSTPRPRGIHNNLVISVLI